MYRQEIAEPWDRLVRGEEPCQPKVDGPVDFSIALDATSRAVSNILTDGNFKEQKAKQLDQGPLPTLLMIRTFGLTARLEELVTLPTATEQISTDAWALLPQRCQGLLIALLGDVVQDIVRRKSPVVFIPAPGRTISAELWEYLKRANTLTNQLIEREPTAFIV